MIKPNLFLVLNEACNLDCSYCNVVKTKQALSRDAIVKSFVYYFKFFPRKEAYNIFFIGWEPLLSWKNLMFAILFLRKFESISWKQISIQLPTNGTLLTKEMCDFFQLYWVKVSVSIDSLDPEYHHRDFVGTSETSSTPLLATKMDLIRQYEAVFRVKMVVIPEMLPTIERDYHFFMGLGIKHINIQPAHGVYWSDEHIWIYISIIKSIKWDISHRDECNSSILKKSESVTHKMKRCAKGESEICIDGYGNVLVCDAFLAYDPQKRKSIYAHDNIFTPAFNQEKFELWRDWKYCDNSLIADENGKIDKDITKCKTCDESISCSKLCNAVPINGRPLDNDIILSNFKLFKLLDAILV